MNHRILVVEDDHLLAATIAEDLSDQGLAPIVCATAEEAIAALERERVALAIVDHHLGDGVTGAEFTRRSRERAPGVPVIGISGRLGTEQALTSAGVCCFIQKPFGSARLKQAVRWALDVYHAIDGSCGVSPAE